MFSKTNSNSMGHIVILKRDTPEESTLVKFENNQFDPTKSYTTIKKQEQLKQTGEITTSDLNSNQNIPSLISEHLRGEKDES